MAVVAFGRFIVGAFHVHDPTFVAAAFDLVASFFTLYLLYRLSVDFPSRGLLTQNQRLLTITLFLAIIQFPLAWVVPFQRLETLPTALYLAISLFCFAKSRTNRLWLLLVPIAALGQSFVRADVPFSFGLAIILVALSESFGKNSRFHREELGTGVLVLLLAGAAQVYLQFIRFPHLSYQPGTSVIQLRSNLTFHVFSNFTIALLPFLLFSAFLIIKRPKLDIIDKLVLASSVLYLPLWFTVGVISEVRIYVPFLFALSMVAAKVFASYANGSGLRDQFSTFPTH